MMRFRPFQTPSMSQFRTDVEGLMEDFLGKQGFARGVSFPALNIWEQEHELFVEAELPGYRQEDLDISVVGNELTLKGSRDDGTAEGVTFHRRERATTEFSRLVELPVDIDAEKVQATLQDGVLRIVLPKAETARPKRVPINVQS